MKRLTYYELLAIKMTAQYYLQNLPRISIEECSSSPIVPFIPSIKKIKQKFNKYVGVDADGWVIYNKKEKSNSLKKSSLFKRIKDENIEKYLDKFTTEEEYQEFIESVKFVEKYEPERCLAAANFNDPLIYRPWTNKE